MFKYSLSSGFVFLIMVLFSSVAPAALVLAIGEADGSGSVVPVDLNASAVVQVFDVGVFAIVSGADETLASFDLPFSINPAASGVSLVGATGSVLPDQGNFDSSVNLAGAGVDLRVFDDVDLDDAITLGADTTTKLFDLQLSVAPTASGPYTVTFPLANGTIDVLDLRNESNVDISPMPAARTSGTVNVAAVPEPNAMLTLPLTLALAVLARRACRAWDAA